MNRSAVLHIPMSQYAYGTDEEHIVIRLRAGRGDLTECILHYGDRACRLTPVLFTEQKMAVVAQTEEFDYWETMLEHPYKRLCYYFTLSDGREEVLYYDSRIIPWMTARNIISCHSITAQILLHLLNGHRIRSSIIFFPTALPLSTGIFAAEERRRNGAV